MTMQKKAVVFTLGCKVNDVESGSIIRGLKEMGFEVYRELEFADLYIVNTCAVTAEAERKSRQAVGKALKRNEKGKVIVCGCASQKSPAAFFEKDERVVAVTGAQGKNRVLELAREILRAEGENQGVQGENQFGVFTDDFGKVYEEMLTP